MMRVMADSAEQCNSKKVNESAGFMTDQMVNMENKSSGKQQGNRFSPQIIRIALSIRQRSKVLIIKLHNQMHECFHPSESLQEQRRKKKLHYGFNLELYSRIHDEFVKTSKNKVGGHIMMDEMRLKSGIYFHSRSHEVNGFTTDGDGIKIDKEISNLLSESKKCKDGSLVKENIEVREKGVSTYVNQW